MSHRAAASHGERGDWFIQPARSPLASQPRAPGSVTAVYLLEHHGWSGVATSGFGRPSIVPITLGVSGLYRRFELPALASIPGCGRAASVGIYSRVRSGRGIFWHLFPGAVELPALASIPGIWHLFPGAVADGVDNIKELTPNASWGAIGAATITCNADGQYSAGLTRTGTFTLDFPAVCMRARTGSTGQLDPTIRRRARATCASSSRYRYALPTLAKARTATPPASLTRRIRSAPHGCLS